MQPLRREKMVHALSYKSHAILYLSTEHESLLATSCIIRLAAAVSAPLQPQIKIAAFEFPSAPYVRLGDPRSGRPRHSQFQFRLCRRSGPRTLSGRERRSGPRNLPGVPGSQSRAAAVAAKRKSRKIKKLEISAAKV
jgi:hypothetical protein